MAEFKNLPIVFGQRLDRFPEQCITIRPDGTGKRPGHSICKPVPIQPGSGPHAVIRHIHFPAGVSLEALQMLPFHSRKGLEQNRPQFEIDRNLRIVFKKAIFPQAASRAS